MFLPHTLASHTAAALCSDSNLPLSLIVFTFLKILSLLLTVLLALHYLGPQKRWYRENPKHFSAPCSKVSSSVRGYNRRLWLVLSENVTV